MASTHPGSRPRLSTSKAVLFARSLIIEGCSVTNGTFPRLAPHRCGRAYGPSVGYRPGLAACCFMPQHSLVLAQSHLVGVYAGGPEPRASKRDHETGCRDDHPIGKQSLMLCFRGASALDALRLPRVSNTETPFR